MYCRESGLGIVFLEYFSVMLQKYFSKNKDLFFN